MGIAAFWVYMAMWLPVECDRLILKNGTVIPLVAGYRIWGRNLRFQVASGRRYSVGVRRVNWSRTFARSRAEKPLPVEDLSVQRAIPWDHPQFRDKMTKLKDIVITGEDVAGFAAGRRGPLGQDKDLEKNPRKLP